MVKEGEEEPDYYALLELDETSTEKDIQRAFRKQAFKYHSDKNSSTSASDQFHLLTRARDFLSNPEQRASYDAVRRQKQEARLRLEKVESERRSWIDALERSELAAAQGDRKRKRQEGLEEQLARQGAEMRADLERQRDANVAKKSFDKRDTTSEGSGQSGSGASISIRFRDRLQEEHRVKSKITDIFSTFGQISEVIYRSSKTNKTQSALVAFEYSDAAYAAASADLKSLSRSNLEVRQITLIPSSAADTTYSSQTVRHDGSQQSKTAAAAAITTEFPGGRVTGTQYESNILERMKQRQRERNKLEEHESATKA